MNRPEKLYLQLIFLKREKGNNNSGGSSGSSGGNPDYGGGGGGGATKLFEKLVETPSSDPCAGIRSLNERLNKLASLNHNSFLHEQSQSKGFEYGYEFDLDIKNNMIIYSDPRSQNIRNVYNYDMIWSDDKITVGFHHAHPFKSAPSIFDAFNGSEGYAQLIQQGSAASAYRDAFYKYFSSTVVTPDYIYGITIKNESKWKEFSANKSKLNDQFNSLYRQLRKDNPTWDIKDAQERAFLDLIGEAVNLYRVNVPFNWDGIEFLEYQNIEKGSDGRKKFRDCN